MCSALTEPAIAIVVAVAENGVIGNNNTLPWRLPKDLAYFKKITMGHPVVMGRKTYESIGKPLPGRINIVVTRNADWQAQGVTVCGSLKQALDEGAKVARKNNVAQIMVIGGAEFYAQVLPIATRLYLTEVHAEIDGDTYFPSFDRSHWQAKESIRYEADAGNPYAYSFVLLERRKEVLD